MTSDSSDVRNELTHVYAAEVGHLVAKMAGETVILHKDSGEYFGLNAVGSRIWELLQPQSTLEGLVAALAEEFAADQSTIESDVRQLLAELVRAGLVRHVESPSAS